MELDMEVEYGNVIYKGNKNYFMTLTRIVTYPIGDNYTPDM